MIYTRREKDREFLEINIIKLEICKTVEEFKICKRAKNTANLSLKSNNIYSMPALKGKIREEDHTRRQKRVPPWCYRVDYYK